MKPTDFYFFVNDNNYFVFIEKEFYFQKITMFPSVKEGVEHILPQNDRFYFLPCEYNVWELWVNHKKGEEVDLDTCIVQGRMMLLNAGFTELGKV